MSVHRIPSLNWLRVFEAAARTESFAEAARQLNMSQPAVSQQVKALESHLGTVLFERSAQSVRLTDTGHAFLPSVQHAITSVETTAEGLFGEAKQETLYVQSILIFATGFIAPRLPDFRQRHPNINLQIATAIDFDDFNRQYSDLQITFGNPAVLGLNGDPLFGETLFPVATPEIAETIQHPEDLIDHPLIEVAAHNLGWINVLDHARVKPTNANLIFADSTVMSFSIALHGGGIALARPPISDTLQQRFGLVPCLPDFEMPGAEYHYLAYSSLKTMRPAARHFRNWLLDEVAQAKSNALGRT